MAVQVAHGKAGVVSSGHTLATEAALDVLKSGGNAVDAAICGALVLAVVCPYACSLAGDMYMLIHNGKRVEGLNATGRSPGAANPALFPDGVDRSGIRAATVPGFLAGAADALAKFGTRTIAQLIGPAITFAEQGFTVHPYFTKNIEERKGLLLRDPEASDLFMPEGVPVQPGATFVQSDLAATLKVIARDGAGAFYHGRITKQIVHACHRVGGLFIDADFAEHRSLWQEPIAAPFYGHDVWTMPPNSYGPTLLLQLIALEAGKVHTADSSEALMLQGFAARSAAYRAVARLIADPKLTEDQARALVDEAVARGSMPSPKQKPVSETTSTSTTNIVVIDKDGLGVSLIESISTPFGAGMVIEGTGIVLNNRMAGFTTDPESMNCVAPQKRPAHTLAPCIVTKNGALTMSIGTPGTVGQTCTLAQILARVLARGENVAAAIAAPRWSVDFQGKLIVEDTAPSSLTDAALAAGGGTMPTGWISFGSVKIAAADADGLHGYADDRRCAATAAT